jgi:hypothetical protein
MNRNITAIILIVLAIGTYMTFTRAKLAEVNEVRAVNDQYIAAIGNADQLIKVRDKVLKDYNALSDQDRVRLDKMLPDTVDNIRLIIDLNSVALRHGFSLRNISASASNSNKPASNAQQSQDAPRGSGGAGSTIPTPVLDTVKVSFSVTAPYQQFIDLMKDLEANLRIMDVTHLTVTAAQAGGAYDFGVELKTYWLRQQ